MFQLVTQEGKILGTTSIDKNGYQLIEKTDLTRLSAGVYYIKIVLENLAGEKINSVQLILDKSSVEILLNNGRFSMTNLFFPNEDYTILSIKSTPKKKLKNLNISSVSSIWK